MNIFYLLLRIKMFDDEEINWNEFDANIFNTPKENVKYELIRKHKCTHVGCNKSYRNKSSLNIHTRSHNEIILFKCHYDNCNKSYKSKSSLNKHLLSHKGIKSRKFACTYNGCNKSFYDKYALKRHALTHNKYKVIKCSYYQRGCSVSFDSISELNEHMKDVHGCIDDYNCDICNKIFSNKHNLNRHIQSHFD